MSRSKKKPYYTDQQGSSSTKPTKRKATRAVRNSEDISNGSFYKRISDSWDIRDWSFYCPKDKKAYRK